LDPVCVLRGVRWECDGVKNKTPPKSYAGLPGTTQPARRVCLPIISSDDEGSD
jgi:hypothetical protein